MTGWEAFLILVGIALVIFALSTLFRRGGDGTRSPRGRITTFPPDGLYTPDRPRREPQVWTYKTKTVEYVPRETKPKTGTKGAQPTKSAGRKPLPDDPDLSTKTQ